MTRRYRRIVLVGSAQITPTRVYAHELEYIDYARLNGEGNPGPLSLELDGLAVLGWLEARAAVAQGVGPVSILALWRWIRPVR